ncbi:flagellar biosynthesis protein FlhA [Novimethylophilus kurashikiensis]|uniref:Flagellar biosynthesis protein FlhA n=1 Tax=Novimethylophilus kurashikiensis TaxID=1825523 RepID=A0A2R5FAQ0_9PROT|nr:flagellar biosynthesis protein FlhA [Novimethylophilus kurashikiensis]GBG15312.1 flagellar biosynthesis protein FlhA [Novimethylophilus kurashikiensis]
MAVLAAPRLNIREFAAPLLIIMILMMMVLPLPPFLLDLLFTFNIALSIIVIMVSVYTLKPLDFAAFPTVLLLTTLLRLSLNVASARVVLMEGHTGPDAAGKVIEAFGHILVGGNYTVGIIVFIILVIINFVVITKGAGRIAEVSARFTLDAMPGKQMAIDADLNAGLIGEEVARKRRSEIAQEAEFYGSMDGASKFVRGDAVAGIMITLINIIGGLIVGMVQHGLDFGTALNNYTLLTIGDGLVAQIPALIISTAAGIVVTRVGADSNEDIGSQLLGQMMSNSKVLYLTGGMLMALGILPGMPHFAFMALGGLTAGAGYLMDKRAREAEVTAREEAATAPPPPAEMPEVGWDDVVPVDILGLEVGYRLIPLVDRGQDGELLRRIRGIRKKFAQDMGFLVPAVHIRDNLELKPNAYRVTLKGVEVGQGEAYTGQYLAINPGRVMGELTGTKTTDPTFGLPATWVTEENREQAQAFGYTVVDASTVVATHLSNVIQSHAPELLGREETQQLLDRVGKESPKLVEDLIPKVLPLGTLQKVLQNLLSEGVHIRDMRTIIEALSDHASRTQDGDQLTAAVRVSLGRAITQQLFPGNSEIQVIAMAPRLEGILMQATQTTGAEGPGLEPGLAEQLLQGINQAAEQQEQMGIPAVLLVPSPLRMLLARFLRRSIPHLNVLAHGEIPDGRMIRVMHTVGG